MNALVVFVSQDPEANYQHGITNGIWGFSLPGDSTKVRAGDIIILARGFSEGSPRKLIDVWLRSSVKTLAISTVVADYAKEDRPEWPDEHEGQVKYPHRIRFRTPVTVMNDVNLSGLDEQIVDAMQRSGSANGRANVVEGFDPRGLPLQPDDKVTNKESSPIRQTEPKLHMFPYLENHLAATGYAFSGRTLRMFYAAIRAKPFVILAGNSGTGKSRLVRLFAEACGSTAANGGFHLVAVRPDWSDGGELLGYLDLQNNFRPGQLLEPLLRAHAQPQQPVFVCLDEMNLARVEHYFSDFLSKIESRRRSADGSVVSDAVISARDLELLSPASIPESLRATLARLKSAEQGVCLPPNLIVVGTANMDETTHAFSRKVLDRANTLEIDAGRLGADLPSPAAVAPPTQSLGAIDLTAPFVTAQDMVHDPKHAEALAHVASLLDSLNDILSEANLQVAYRTRDEAAAFFIHATSVGLSSDEADHAIVMQKILPRVQGSSPRLARILRELLNRFQPGGLIDSNSEKLKEELPALRKDTSRSPLVRKIASMWLVYEEEGFTSFWVA